MLFRPSYCANCGEKIEREDWGLFTSRRFCELCETEFKAHDLLPRVVVGASLIALIFGVGGYLKNGSGAAADATVARQAKSTTERQTAPAAVNPVSTSLLQAKTNSNAPQIENATPAARTVVALPPPKLQVNEKEPGAEPMYYCGAQTKKGTPCTRHVKGNTRCFQHTGMPAMLPPDKLRAG